MLELMSGGDLREFLIDGGQLEESTAKYFFLQMVLALEYINLIRFFLNYRLLILVYPSW